MLRALILLVVVMFMTAFISDAMAMTIGSKTDNLAAGVARPPTPAMNCGNFGVEPFAMRSSDKVIANKALNTIAAESSINGFAMVETQFVAMDHTGPQANQAMNETLIAVAKEQTIGDLMAQNLELHSRAAPDSNAALSNSMVAMI